MSAPCIDLHGCAAYAESVGKRVFGSTRHGHLLGKGRFEVFASTGHPAVHMLLGWHASNVESVSLRDNRGGTMNDASPFLDEPDLRRLTGRHQKSRQIDWLRTAGIPFRVNATGHPIVLWAALHGRGQKAIEGWQPRALET